MEGASSSYGVTTITITNHDGGRVIGNYAVNLRVVGGAFQGTSETKFYFRNYSSAIWLTTDVEGTGIYLDVDIGLKNLHILGKILDHVRDYARDRFQALVTHLGGGNTHG